MVHTIESPPGAGRTAAVPTIGGWAAAKDLPRLSEMLAVTVFFGAWRISTYVTTLIFVTLALVRHDRRVMAYWWCWIAGFETAYQLTGLAVGSLYIPGAAGLLALPGLVTVPYLTWRRGIRPSLWPMLVVAGIWVLWIAFGFHANQVETPAHFSASTEALNEGAKTAWALAYFLPLVSTVELRDRLSRFYGEHVASRLPILSAPSSKAARRSSI